MSRITSIFTRVRDSLGDYKGDRWTNEILLRLLTEAQNDIAKQTEIIKDIIVVVLSPGVHSYILPDKTVSVFRAIYDGTKIPIKTTEFMDSQDSEWMIRTTESDVTTIIYDKLARNKLRVYPTPVSTTLSSPYTINEDLGFFADMTEFDDFGPFGTVGSVIDTTVDTTEIINLYGVATLVTDEAGLILHRSKCPEDLVSVNDQLTLDSCWDDALKHYVVGQAYLQNISEQNRALSKDSLALYARELDVIQETSTAESVSDSHHDTLYNGMG